jgi:hypothetical protein
MLVQLENPVFVIVFIPVQMIVVNYWLSSVGTAMG